MQVLKNHRYSQTKVAQGSMMAKRGTNQVCRLLAPSNQGVEKIEQILESKNWTDSTDSTFTMAREKTSYGTWLQSGKEIGK